MMKIAQRLTLIWLLISKFLQKTKIRGNPNKIILYSLSTSPPIEPFSNNTIVKSQGKTPEEQKSDNNNRKVENQKPDEPAEPDLKIEQRKESESDEVFNPPPHTSLICNNEHFDGQWDRIKPDLYRHNQLVYSDKQGLGFIFYFISSIN